MKMSAVMCTASTCNKNYMFGFKIVTFQHCQWGRRPSTFSHGRSHFNPCFNVCVSFMFRKVPFACYGTNGSKGLAPLFLFVPGSVMRLVQNRWVICEDRGSVWAGHNNLFSLARSLARQKFGTENVGVPSPLPPPNSEILAKPLKLSYCFLDVVINRKWFTVLSRIFSKTVKVGQLSFYVGHSNRILLTNFLI